MATNYRVATKDKAQQVEIREEFDTYKEAYNYYMEKRELYGTNVFMY